MTSNFAAPAALGQKRSGADDFRRDYCVQDTYYFNVDGKNDLTRLPDGSIDDYGLSKAQRIELLVNRNFVTTNKPHDDLWPYDDTGMGVSMRFRASGFVRK